MKKCSVYNPNENKRVKMRFTWNHKFGLEFSNFSSSILMTRSALNGLGVIFIISENFGRISLVSNQFKFSTLVLAWTNGRIFCYKGQTFQSCQYPKFLYRITYTVYVKPFKPYCKLYCIIDILLYKCHLNTILLFDIPYIIYRIC